MKSGRINMHEIRSNSLALRLFLSATAFIPEISAKSSGFWVQPCSIITSGERTSGSYLAGTQSLYLREADAELALPLTHFPFATPGAGAGWGCGRRKRRVIRFQSMIAMIFLSYSRRG